MALDGSTGPDSPLVDLRRRGQFLFGVLLWASAVGFVVVVCSCALVAYDYAISFMERVRLGLGFATHVHGPDWFLLITLSSGPVIGVVALLFLLQWYRQLWLRRVALVWPHARERRHLSRWQPVPFHGSDSERQEARRISVHCCSRPSGQIEIAPNLRRTTKGERSGCCKN
jgi:hypothetical protein